MTAETVPEEHKVVLVRTVGGNPSFVPDQGGGNAAFAQGNRPMAVIGQKGPPLGPTLPMSSTSHLSRQAQ